MTDIASIMPGKSRVCAFSVFVLFAAVLSAAPDKTYDWSQARELFPGIEHAHISTGTPRPLKINVVRVDLSRDDLHFMTVKRDPDWGKPMPDHPELPIRTRRISVREFMENALEQGIDMLVAVNSTPWSPWRKPYTHTYAAKTGLLISDGDKIEDANGRPVFLITRKGEFQIRKVGKDEDTSQIQLAVAGFSMILENGKTMGTKSLAPRTAFGLTENNRHMLIMTVDGRMKYISEGVSTLELGEWMQYFGAVIAINMDGGGSTTLVVSDGEGSIRRLNEGTIYRKVAAPLGIFRVRPSVPETAPSAGD